MTNLQTCCKRQAIRWRNAASILGYTDVISIAGRAARKAPASVHQSAEDRRLNTGARPKLKARLLCRSIFAVLGVRSDGRLWRALCVYVGNGDKYAQQTYLANFR